MLSMDIESDMSFTSVSIMSEVLMPLQADASIDPWKLCPKWCEFPEAPATGVRKPANNHSHADKWNKVQEWDPGKRDHVK